MTTTQKHAFLAAAAAATILGLSLAVPLALQFRERRRIQEVGPEIMTSAEAMHGTYRSNALAGDRKYKGKVIELTGEVHSVDDERLYFYTVNNLNPIRHANIICRMDPSARDGFAKAQHYLPFTVVGVCEGVVREAPFGGPVIVLNHCRPAELRTDSQPTRARQ